MEKNLNRLKKMMSKDYDWEKHYDEDLDSIEDIFKKCFEVVLLSNNSGLKGYRCTGFDVEDTPKALYRSLYLGEPKEVDFSDMYKTGMLFAFKSPDDLFFATITLFKYEFGVYAYCKNKEDIQGKGTWVTGGWPSADNGWNCSNPKGQLWFEVLKMALEFEHDVYPGNDFKV